MRSSLFSELLLLGLALLTACHPEAPSESAPSTVMTVDGPIPADSMGLTLIHEHVFLDWTPADSIDPGQWQRDSAFTRILPYLQEARALGVQTILECTPNYLGRDPELLRRLSAASGIRLLTNTGLYGARNDQHIPAFAFAEDAGQLAERWTQEYENGISGTNVRPGFIKIGVDGDSLLSPIDEKLVRAAARTHLRTGLTIVAHTGPDAPARQEVDILAEEGVAPDAWVWTHAQNGTPETQAELAARGAWISLDGMGWIQPAGGDSTALKQYLNMLTNLKEKNLLHRTLISHDAGWYTYGEPGGGETYQPYTAIFQLVIPELRKRGFTEADIRQLLVVNPREAYSIRVRQKVN